MTPRPPPPRPPERQHFTASHDLQTSDVTSLSRHDHLHHHPPKPSVPRRDEAREAPEPTGIRAPEGKHQAAAAARRISRDCKKKKTLCPETTDLISVTCSASCRERPLLLTDCKPEGTGALIPPKQKKQIVLGQKIPLITTASPASIRIKT